jgi:hypothetical protein
MLVPEEASHSAFFPPIFRYLAKAIMAKSPQKARKNRLMHWFDAFSRTQK